MRGLFFLLALPPPLCVSVMDVDQPTRRNGRLYTTIVRIYVYSCWMSNESKRLKRVGTAVSHPFMTRHSPSFSLSYWCASTFCGITNCSEFFYTDETNKQKKRKSWNVEMKSFQKHRMARVIPMRIKSSESIFYFVHAQSLEICWLIV